MIEPEGQHSMCKPAYALARKPCCSCSHCVSLGCFVPNDPLTSCVSLSWQLETTLCGKPPLLHALYLPFTQHCARGPFINAYTPAAVVACISVRGSPPQVVAVACYNWLQQPDLSDCCVHCCSTATGPIALVAIPFGTVNWCICREGPCCTMQCN